MLFLGTAAYAGPVVNVGYVHDLIAQKWGIDVPYHQDLTDYSVVANM